jgi:ABC-type oligopeptide transport system ATPase subunit
MSEATPLLSVRGLKKYFPYKTGWFKSDYKRAVDDVSFDIQTGRTMALVGESGSGKSTVGLMILDLLTPTAGEVLYHGARVSGRKGAAWLALRREIQVIFQDPYSSLNTRMNIGEILTEGMIIHRIGTNQTERLRRASELLERVGMPPNAIDRYPHEFSGGQRQRIAIARALSVGPKFIVCDEPTSALDVSVQSQVLNLLRKLQREEQLTYLFITHNLGVVEYLADEVCVMEQGKIVERGTVEQIFDAPQMAYTQRLLSSVPSLDPAHRKIREEAPA